MLSPRENQNLFGHREAKKLVLNAFHSPRFPHAWICAGEFGIGKATFAFHIARYILSDRTNHDTFFPNTDPLYRRILAQSQEDLWVIGNDTEPEIGIEPIRALNTALQHTSRKGGWRVIIIDGAEKLNRNAANALLKNLEEPPSKTVFLLLTTLPCRLLPTIRSRCQVMVFSPLEEEDMKKVLAAQGVTLPSFSSLAEGSPGRLLRLMEGKGSQIFSDLQTVLKGGNPFPFIQNYTENESNYSLVEGLLRTFLYTTLISKLREKEPVASMLTTYEKVTHLLNHCREDELDRSTTLACVFNEMMR